MDWATSEIVTVLAFLLPGLVAATVFYSLTAYSRPNEFGYIVQALAFTVAAQAATWIVLILANLTWDVNSWPAGVETVISVFSAIALALIMAGFVNHDVAHSFLRIIRVTKETSYSSEWYSAFHRFDESFVVLHMKGGRRLYGWPQEWPSHPDQGHFIIADPEWLTDSARLPITGVSVILIPGSEVDMVEFLTPMWSDGTEGAENDKSAKPSPE